MADLSFDHRGGVQGGVMAVIGGVKCIAVGMACLAQVPSASAAALAEASPMQYSREKARAQYVRPASIPAPKDNQVTEDRVHLGKALFFDPRLSRSGTISCGTCHNPSFAWGDGMPKGVGHGSKTLGRRTPTILNVAWGELYFWDGRAGSLEEQALGPISAPGEMNLPVDEMLKKLNLIQGYRPLFEKAYPGEGITPEVVAKAIASFERTVVSAKAPFDRWIEGREDAISDKAKLGFDLFNSKASCVQCHRGWNFTDDGFHDIGLNSSDPGRGAVLEGIPAVKFAKKTPTLRNVEARAPYMHDGSEPTLEAAVRFYNRGGDVRRESVALPIKPLGLTDAEIDALCEFMKTLTSADPEVTLPVLPR